MIFYSKYNEIHKNHNTNNKNQVVKTGNVYIIDHMWCY